jgi:hypothetical protein
MAEPSIAAADYCYLATTGRRSGRPHTVELWFVLLERAAGRSVCLMHEREHPADWVRNLRHDPRVTLRLVSRDAELIEAAARLVAPDSAEDALTRERMVAKYQPRTRDNLDHWGRTAIVVAIDLPRLPS